MLFIKKRSYIYIYILYNRYIYHIFFIYSSVKTVVSMSGLLWLMLEWTWGFRDLEIVIFFPSDIFSGVELLVKFLIFSGTSIPFPQVVIPLCICIEWFFFFPATQMVTHCLPIMSSYQHSPQDEIFRKPRTQKRQESEGCSSSPFSFCLNFTTLKLVVTKIFTEFAWKWVSQECVHAIPSKRSVMADILFFATWQKDIVLWESMFACSLLPGVCKKSMLEAWGKGERRWPRFQKSTGWRREDPTLAFMKTLVLVIQESDH